MDHIRVKMTKQKNADYFNVEPGSVIKLRLRDYLRGVVSSEISPDYIEACKAQAVASRTFAYPFVRSGDPISDSSSNAQCYSAERMDNEEYKNCYKAINDTEGQLLYYGDNIVNMCVYSASNGGTTVSSEERWGDYRPYLIEQKDYWDEHVSHGVQRGHGVGMSQTGAMYAASQGSSYLEILHFYYPGTYVCKYCESQTVLASDLINGFRKMVDEHWDYVAGAAQEGKVDCSGAFTYWYHELGSYMFHGSNTMFRLYSTVVGKIGDVILVPGMAVYKMREWKSDEQGHRWYNTEPGDVFHVGLYVGDNKVIEAKGTRWGVVISDLSEWDLAGRLKDTNYNLKDSSDESNSNYPRNGIVELNSGYLNLRTGPGTNYPAIERAYDGDLLLVLGKNGNWYKVRYKNKDLYGSTRYIKMLPIEDNQIYIVSAKAKGRAEMDRLVNAITSAGFSPVVNKYNSSEL